MPQPTVMPAAFTATAALASTAKEARMPADDARKARRVSVRPAPPWPTTPRSLIDSTGSTQGIRLRIKPPKSAVSSARTKPALAPLALPTTGVTPISVARSPSVSVSVSGAPAIGVSAAG